MSERRRGLSTEELSTKIIEPLLQGDAWVECAWCGRSSQDVGSYNLIEHCLFDHVLRADIVIVRRSELLSSNELGLLAGLPALTGAEEEWRAARLEETFGS